MFVGGFMSYLCYLCLFAYSVVQQTLCCVYVLCFLRLVYPMLPVSLDFPFLIVPSVFSNVYLVSHSHDTWLLSLFPIVSNNPSLYTHHCINFIKLYIYFLYMFFSLFELDWKTPHNKINCLILIIVWRHFR
jgi:hypothetical protein